MSRKYTLAQSSEAEDLAAQIAELSTSPCWEPFMAWLYRQAMFPQITLSDPNPLVAVAQQARMNLVQQIQNKLNETKRQN